MQLIYDANNFLRRRFEVGQSVMNCYHEVQASPGVIVFDGAHALKRRRDLFPAYKARRVLPATSIFDQFKLFEEVCQHLDVALIRVPYWEADDVIATLVRSANDDIHIKSTDVDFLQLDRVTIDRTTPAPAEPRFLRVYKAVVGDASDNIPGFKSFGKGGWAKLTADDKEELESFLKASSEYLPNNLPTATKNWLEEPENRALVRVFYEIVGLYDVPMDEIVANTKIGIADPGKVHEQIKRYML